MDAVNFISVGSVRSRCLRLQRDNHTVDKAEKRYGLSKERYAGYSERSSGCGPSRQSCGVQVNLHGSLLSKIQEYCRSQEVSRSLQQCGTSLLNFLLINRNRSLETVT